MLARLFQARCPLYTGSLSFERMKHYLLLFFSTLLLLFTLSQTDGRVSGFSCAGQHELRTADNADKRLVKRRCAKKCLKHQTHSEQQNGATAATDCSQQFYAVIAANGSAEFFSSGFSQPVSPSADSIHQTPSLEADPDPPRFS